MRTVQDDDGRRYLLVKRSDEQWLVLDPKTGRESSRPATDFETIAETAPLATAARAVPEPVGTVLTAVPTERALGLLIEIDREGPLSVRRLIERYEYCESDLHGRLAEFRAAGLIEERRVAGERGYASTAKTSAALATLQVD